MAKKYKLVEDKDDNGGGIIIGIILIITLFILFFLSPGIFISSFVNFLVPLEGRIIWAIAIICSISVLGFLYFNYEDEMYFIYLWICGILSAVILIITLLSPNNIFLNTLGRMFNYYEIENCERCGSDGCVNADELASFTNLSAFQNEDEIKKFQDWLDLNHPLWVNDRGVWKNLRVGTESEPSRHMEGKSYGISDKNTTNAIAKWGREYFQTGPCSICNKNGTCSDELLK